MKTSVYNITTKDLKEEIGLDYYENILNSKSILIQIFSEEILSKIKAKLINIKKIFPDAIIIGTSTDSEIKTKGTIVSISTFESTTLKNNYINIQDSFQVGAHIAKELISKKTKLIISFSNSLINKKEYIDGINSVISKDIITNEISHDNNIFEGSCIIYNDTINKHGTVVVALDYDTLHAKQFYTFGLDKISIKHTITKSTHNRVYTIDNLKAIDFYTKYLGSDITDDLLSTNINFPLIKRENSLNITRTVIHTNEDGSLEFTGNLDEGSEVYLSIITSTETKIYNAIRNLINQTLKEYDTINNSLEKNVLLEKKYSKNIKNKYELLISSMSEGILTCSEEKKISDANSAAVKLLGYSKAELSTMNISDLTTKDSCEIFLKFKNKGSNETFEATLIKKDASLLFTIINLITMVPEMENIHMIIIVDITEVKEKDKQLLIQSKQAQMGEMINMIAHQWRQPLNSISASAIQLNMKSDLDILKKEDIQKTTDFIQKISQQMSQTINDFMNFAKTSNVHELVQLNDLFKEIIGIIEAQFTASSIQVEIKNEKNISIIIFKQELSHILINLLTNARDALKKSNQENKKIQIKVYIIKHDCYIEVQDNGTGIPKDVIHRIFEPYFTTKEQGEGTGLGLYMTKKILQEVLNGTIQVQNVDEGTKFTIQLKECLT